MPSINSSRDKGLVQSSGRGSSYTDLAADSVGYRIHVEKITMSATEMDQGNGDNKTIKGAAYKLPDGASVLWASLGLETAGTGGTGTVQLMTHTAVSSANGSDGTEIAGAGAAGSIGATLRDLPVGTNGTVGDAISTTLGFQTGAASETFFHVASTATCAGITSSVDLILCVGYVGKAPIEI